MSNKVKFEFEGKTNDGHAVCDHCGKAIFSTHNQENWFHCHNMNIYCDSLEATPRATTGYGDATEFKKKVSDGI